MSFPHEFVDGPGNTASGEQVMDNFRYVLGNLELVRAALPAGESVLGAAADIPGFTVDVELDEPGLVLVLANIQYAIGSSGGSTPGSAVGANGDLVLLRGATTLRTVTISASAADLFAHNGTAMLQWAGVLAAGTYTFKLRGSVGGVNSPAASVQGSGESDFTVLTWKTEG